MVVVHTVGLVLSSRQVRRAARVSSLDLERLAPPGCRLDSGTGVPEPGIFIYRVMEPINTSPSIFATNNN